MCYPKIGHRSDEVNLFTTKKEFLVGDNHGFLDIGER